MQSSGDGPVFQLTILINLCRYSSATNSRKYEYVYHLPDTVKNGNDVAQSYSAVVILHSRALVI